MENLTFAEYVTDCAGLEGCIIMSEIVWNPRNEDTDMYELARGLLERIFLDYKKEGHDRTETLAQGVQELIWINRLIQKQAEMIGRKENEKRETSAPVFER